MESEEVEYTDKEQIQQILDSIISDRVIWMAMDYTDFFEPQYSVHIEYEQKDFNKSGVSYRFIKGKMPPFIQ